MLIIDTHIWLKWGLEDEKALPAFVRERIRTEARTTVSAISCWEIVWLVQKRRLELPLPPVEWIDASLAALEIECIPISGKIAGTAAKLPEHHKDPADRIIIATAMIHQATLASLDGMFTKYAEIAPLLLRS